MDMNIKFENVLKYLTTLTNKHAPIKKQSRREMKLKGKPWINNRILKMMSTQGRILLKLRKQHTPDNLKLYNKYRNCMPNELKECKARYFDNYFSTNTQNMKSCGQVSRKLFFISLPLFQSIRLMVMMEV